jgi:hypothetical protein
MTESSLFSSSSIRSWSSESLTSVVFYVGSRLESIDCRPVILSRCCLVNHKKYDQQISDKQYTIKMVEIAVDDTLLIEYESLHSNREEGDLKVNDNFSLQLTGGVISRGK